MNATDSKLIETKGLESDLIEINQLLEKDLITKEEAEKRRGLITGVRFNRPLGFRSLCL